MSPPEYLADSYCPDIPYDAITLLTIHTVVVAKLINNRNSDAWWTVAYNYYSDDDFDIGPVDGLVFTIYDYIMRCLLTGFYIDPDEGVPVVAEFVLEGVVSSLPFDLNPHIPEEAILDELIYYSSHNSYDTSVRTVPHHQEYRRLHRMVMIYNELGNNNTNLDEEVQNKIFKGYHTPPHLWDGFKVCHLPDSVSLDVVLESLPHGFDFSLRQEHYTEERWETTIMLTDDRDFYYDMSSEQKDRLTENLSVQSIDYPEGFASKMLELLVIQEVYPQFFDSDYAENFGHMLKYYFPPNVFSKNYGLFRKDRTLAEVVSDIDYDYYHPLLNDELSKMSLSAYNRSKRDLREGNVNNGRTPRVSASSGARAVRSRESAPEVAAVQKELNLSRDFVRSVEDLTNERIDSMEYLDLVEYVDGVTLELTILHAYISNTTESEHQNGDTKTTTTSKGNNDMSNKANDRASREAAAKEEKRQNYFETFGHYPGEAPGAAEPTPTIQAEKIVVEAPVQAGHKSTARAPRVATPRRNETVRTSHTAAGTASERRANRRKPDNGMSSLARTLIPQAVEEPEEVFAAPTDTIVIGAPSTVDTVVSIPELDAEVVVEEVEVVEVVDTSKMELPPKSKRILTRDMSLIEIAEKLAMTLLPASGLMTANQLPHDELVVEIDADPDYEHKYYHCEIEDGKVHANLVVQFQEQWAATFFHNSRGSAIMRTHERMTLPEGREMEVTGESEVFMYPWAEAKQVLDPAFVKSTAIHVPLYNVHTTNLYVYFDSYGKLYFLARDKSTEEMESYDKHQIDPEWAEAEMTHPDYDTMSTTYRIEPASTVNPLLEYDLETNELFEPELNPIELPSLRATDVQDAANSMSRLLQHRELKRECQVAETVWEKQTKVDIDENDAAELGEWITEWAEMNKDERSKVNIINLMLEIPLPKEARRSLVGYATALYNDLLKYNCATDVQVTDIVADFKTVEEKVVAKEGSAWIMPLGRLNSIFKAMMLTYISNIHITSTEESVGMFEVTVSSVVFSSRNGLTLLPWTVQSMGLNLEDLKGGMVADMEDRNTEALTAALAVVVRRLASSNIASCQLMTIDGTVISIGASVLKAKSYILFTK